MSGKGDRIRDKERESGRRTRHPGDVRYREEWTGRTAREGNREAKREREGGGGGREREGGRREREKGGREGEGGREGRETETERQRR